MQGGQRELAGLQIESRVGASGAGSVQVGRSVSIITLPTRNIATFVDAFPLQVGDRARLGGEQAIGERVGHDAIEFFGHLRSKLRSPASTWASRIPSFEATSAPPRSN